MKLTQRQLRKVILEALNLHEQSFSSLPGEYVAIVDSSNIYPEVEGIQIKSITIDANNAVTYEEAGGNSSEMADPAMEAKLLNMLDERINDFKFKPPQAPVTQDTATVAAKKKGPSRIAQLQKIIGDKADGKWNRKQKGNTETDDKWKAWLDADQGRNFMAIIKLGLDKNADIPKEAFDSALKRNSASNLATIAGFGKNLTGVLAMAKAIDAMTLDERHAAAMAVALSGEGESELAAAKGVNQEEIIDDAFMEETDDIISGTAEAVNTIKSPEKKSKAIQNAVNLLNAAKEKAKKANDSRKIKNLDRKIKLFTKKTKAEKLGIDMNLGGDPREDLQESQERLSRGALYRRRYYGRY